MQIYSRWLPDTVVYLWELSNHASFKSQDLLISFLGAFYISIYSSDQYSMGLK